MKRQQDNQQSKVQGESVKVPLHACCSKATLNPCVCAYSYRCPEHGVTHIGSHD